MRILHVCDQNWVGMANAFVEAHRRHGHESRLVTLTECVNGAVWDGFGESVKLENGLAPRDPARLKRG